MMAYSKGIFQMFYYIFVKETCKKNYLWLLRVLVIRKTIIFTNGMYLFFKLQNEHSPEAVENHSLCMFVYRVLYVLQYLVRFFGLMFVFFKFFFLLFTI